MPVLLLYFLFMFMFLAFYRRNLNFASSCASVDSKSSSGSNRLGWGKLWFNDITNCTAQEIFRIFCSRFLLLAPRFMGILFWFRLLLFVVIAGVWRCGGSWWYVISINNNISRARSRDKEMRWGKWVKIKEKSLTGLLKVQELVWLLGRTNS